MMRYWVLTIASLVLTLIFANGALFHFTVICMEHNDDMAVSSNVTTSHSDFNSYQESILFGALSFGCIIGNYPTVKLFDMYGFKHTFTGFSIISAVGTIMVPMLGHSFWVVLADRVIQGFALAASFLAFGIVPSDTAYQKELSLFVSLLSCSLQLGPCFIMPVSGLFCSSSIGWEGAYYTSGLLTIVVTIVFHLTYKRTSQTVEKSGSPDESERSTANFVNSKITPEDLDEDSEKKVVVVDEDSQSDSSKEEVPLREILTCPSVWGIMIIAFGDTIGYQTFLLYGPIYINKALGYDVTKTGVLSALPYVISIVTKAFGGVFLDRASCIKEQLRVLLFTFASQAAMTACFLVLTQMTPELAFLGQSMLTLMMVFSGLAFIGLMSGCQIICQQHNYIVTSALAIQDSLGGLVVPALVAFAAPNYAMDEWKLVYFVLTALLTVTNVFFVVLTRVKPAKWTNKHLK
uniref:MFS domain-containing protein n=1 Tax=Steinernema glaseri TaxID=37863 RepID=A0A1I7Y4H7_9BILA